VTVVDPDRKDAQLHGGGDVEDQAVAHHPSFFGLSPEYIEGVQENGGRRLPNAELSFDQDAVEVSSQIEAFDFGPLSVCVTVRDERELHAALPEHIDSLDRAGKWYDQVSSALAFTSEVVRQSHGQAFVQLELVEGASNNLPASSKYVTSARAMSFGIVPKPRSGSADRRRQSLDVEPERRRMLRANGPPTIVCDDVERQDGVVEVQQNRGRKNQTVLQRMSRR